MKGRCFAMLVMVLGVGLLLTGPAMAGEGGCSHFSSAKLEVASAPVETPMTPVDGNSIVVAQATAPAQPCAPKKTEAAQPCAPKTTDAAQPCAAKKTDAAQPCAPKKTDAAQPCAPKK